MPPWQPESVGAMEQGTAGATPGDTGGEDIEETQSQDGRSQAGTGGIGGHIARWGNGRVTPARELGQVGGLCSEWEGARGCGLGKWLYSMFFYK